MKKLFAGILFVALLTAAAGTAFAGGHGRGHHGSGSCYYTGSCVQGRCHEDADNDGVCDYCGAEDGMPLGTELCGYG